MSTTDTNANAYCEALGIEVPRLETVGGSRQANTYALLIVALLERGAPMTLEEVARRFEEAGIAPADRALLALKRCRPARAPVYRDGDLYALDPHDDATAHSLFWLGLKPPATPRLELVRPDPGPLPSADEPLTPRALDEAWREGVPNAWSAQRIAICVLDAHGIAMRPYDVVTFVAARSAWSQLSTRSADFWRRGAAVRVREDGLWELDRGHAAVRSARRAVRERVAQVRRWAEARPDPAIVRATIKRAERRRREHGERLARMRRILVHAFPPAKPEAVVLVDVGRRELASFVGDEIAGARQKLAGADIIAGVGVRALLRILRFEHGARRLAELGPPQKTRQLGRRGRKLKITTSLLIQGSCGISRPLAEADVLRGYLRHGRLDRFRRRLEADAKSLLALYQYGRLHGAVRLRWGFVDEWIPAPWVHQDEPRLRHLKERALERNVPLEVVAGSAPGWAEPWSRAERARVVKDARGWRTWLVDEHEQLIPDVVVQIARLAGGDRGAE